jgi:hypothetical protein
MSLHVATEKRRSDRVRFCKSPRGNTGVGAEMGVTIVDARMGAEGFAFALATVGDDECRTPKNVSSLLPGVSVKVCTIAMGF